MAQPALAPTGTLRAAINLGNPLLAHRLAASAAGAGAVTAGVGGVSVDLAHALAQRLGTPLELVVQDTASQAVDAVVQGTADVGFFAIDPLRGEHLHFTSPYVVIEGSYLVRHDSAIQDNHAVDKAGVRVAVGQGSAYDLYLSRTLAAARIVRAPSSPLVVDVFLEQHLEVAAGVRQQLQMDAARLPGLRLLPGRFMAIHQAMGLPKSRGPGAWASLHAFVEAMKASGFVAAALERHKVQGAVLAAPQSLPAT